MVRAALRCCPMFKQCWCEPNLVFPTVYSKAMTTITVFHLRITIMNISKGQSFNNSKSELFLLV